MTQTFLNAPLVEVPGPSAPPAGFGLYSVTPPIDAGAAGLREGVRWLDEIGGIAAPYAIGCPATFALGTEGAPAWVEAPAFGVSAGLGVDHPLGLGVDELQTLARTRLALQESSAVEAAYWSGKDAAGNPTGAPALAAAAGAQILSATPVSLGVGLGMLEDAIGGFTGALGVIHGARHLLGTLTGLHVRRDGGRLRTLVDTPVALGTGYPGTGPDGTRPAGATWLYATGPVQVLRGPVQDWPVDPRLAMDKTTDATAVHATRLVAVGHSAGLAAVPVTLP